MSEELGLWKRGMASVLEDGGGLWRGRSLSVFILQGEQCTQKLSMENQGCLFCMCRSRASSGQKGVDEQNKLPPQDLL